MEQELLARIEGMSQQESRRYLRAYLDVSWQEACRVYVRLMEYAGR